MATSAGDVVIEVGGPGPVNGSVEQDLDDKMEGGAGQVGRDEVEMTVYQNTGDQLLEGAESQQAVVLHESSTVEASVLFIIKDVTDSDWTKPKLNCSLPLSSALVDLYDSVAKQAGYLAESFLLSWGERESDGLDQAVPLAPRSTQTLFELGMEGDKRYYLYLLDGPDAPPVKDTGNQGAESGAGQTIGLATSVNTSSPSSHSLNNVSAAAAGGGGASSGGSTSWSSHSYSNKSDTGYVGLVNQAMTCYLNSLLQTLFMTPEFRNSLYSWKFSGDMGEGIKSIPFQLQRLFIQLQTSNKRAVETTDVTKSFGWDSSEAWQQHDVQELCRVMFDALEKRLRKDNHERPELINDLYQGDIKDYVKCLECKSESAREDHFLDIPLVIKPFGSTVAYSSVEEALRGFAAPETLNGDNQYHCAKCQKKCDAHKGLKFKKFPYLLTLQLKRFDFDYSMMHRIKLNDRMSFPNLLNLNSFIDQGDLPKTKDRSMLEEEYKSFVVEKFDRPHSSYIMQQTGADGKETSEEVTASKVVDMLAQGPYVYELFSIMIHSGSAIGGHYYAYIKSFTDRHWYCFNDQSVSRISREDIEQTFGGVDRSRSYYSSSMYASSANAYMLMYRRVDKLENAMFQAVENLPGHINEQIQAEQQHEKMEKERQEWEKSLCKFRVFTRHPESNELIERKLEVHKDKTLKFATQEAYRLLGLSRVLPLDRCRLVRYDEYSETLDQSFDYDEQGQSFGHHVGGARSFYTFELFLETRQEGVEFQVYNKGGLNLKVLVVDLPQGAVRDPIFMRGEQGWTVQHFKDVLGKTHSLDTSTMRVALETYQSEGKHLCHMDQTLKSEGFYKKHTVFVCCDEDDYERDFQNSKMRHVLECHANTIKILVTLPPPPKVPHPFLVQANSTYLGNLPPASMESTRPEAERASGFDDNFVDSHPNEGDAKMATHLADSEIVHLNNEGGVADSAFKEDRPNGMLVGVASTAESSGSAKTNPSTGASSSDSGSNAADSGSNAADSGSSAAESGSNAADSGSSAADSGSSVADSGFSSVQVEAGSVGTKKEPRVVTVAIDRRKTLGDLKKMLEADVGVTSMDFKVFRVYSNNQEYEMFRLSDPLQSVPNETRMIVRLGRALMPGEYRIKLFLLQINEVEFFKHLLDSIVAKSMTVLDLKRRIIHETYQHGIHFPYKPDRIRLRKKTWRSPGTVYTDHQVFERDIHVFANYEMFVEPLQGEEPMQETTQMQVYVRRWRPSSCTVDRTMEVILDQNSPDHLRAKLAEISDLPPQDIQYAKSYGSFPSEISVLDIESDLDWDPTVSSVSTSSLSLYDDGAVLYYKDCKEKLLEMTTEQRAKIQKQESARLNKYNISSSSSSQSRYVHHRQEKALKIYTDDDDINPAHSSKSES